MGILIPGPYLLKLIALNIIMKQAVPALFLFLAVMVSGCIQGTTNAGKGMTIVSFEPELSTIYSGEETTFMLKVKNLGSFAATGTANMDLTEWGGECQFSSPKSFDSMIAPNAERGTEGEERTFTWRCTAPDIEKGLHIPYEPRAAVTYDYKTITSQSVTLLPTQELLSIRDSGNSLPSELVSTTDSPVAISIQVKGPIRLREDTNSIEFPVNIKIENVGGGIVEGSKVNLDVEGADGINSLATTECYEGSTDLYLWRGSSQTITCEMSANNVQQLTQARIVATATYQYTILGSTHIEVLGQTKALWPS